MSLSIFIRSSFIILSILLIAVSIIVFNRAYHLKGQRFAFGVLFCFGIVYLFETLRYILPIDYSYFILYWLVGGLALYAVCLAAHYVYYLIQLHAILPIKFTPLIFYVPLFLYVGVIGPLELITTTQFFQVNGWYVQEIIGYRMAIFFLIPAGLIQLLYLLTKGIKYAPSQKRKRLYTNYLYGNIGSLVLSFVTIALINNQVLPAEVFLLLSFIPLLAVIATENYLFSPGFTKHYNKIIELSPIALIVLNHDFEIVEINDRASQWFKVVKKEPIHHFLVTEENMLEMTKFLTTLQMERELMDYPMTLTFDETIHFSVVASIFEIEEQYYYYMMIRDVTKEREQEELNFYLAYHDTLTSLYNRTYFLLKMEEKLTSMTQQETGVLVLSDLNFFKKINDTYGHHVGDAVLEHTAKILSHHIHEPNLLARLGGDEFIFYLHVENEQQAQQLIEKIRFQFTIYPYVNEDIVIEVIPSFGYTMIADGTSYETAYQQADNAMYEDKKRIKAQYNKTAVTS